MDFFFLRWCIPLCRFSSSNSELAVGQRTGGTKPAAGRRPITSRAESLEARRAPFVSAGRRWGQSECQLDVGPLAVIWESESSNKDSGLFSHCRVTSVALWRSNFLLRWGEGEGGQRRPTELRQPPSCHHHSFSCLSRSLLTPTHHQRLSYFCGSSCQLQSRRSW